MPEWLDLTGLYKKRYYQSAVTSLIAVCFTSACAVGPDYKRPVTPDAGSYTEDTLPEKTLSSDVDGGEAQTFVAGHDIDDNWWLLFSSEPLNKLVNEAIDNNPDLQAAQASLRQAIQYAYAGDGAYFPALDIEASTMRQKTTGTSFGQPDAASSIFTLYNASVNVSYTFDFFGGIRRETESLEAQVEFERFQLEATYLSLIGNVITAAIQEASLREQIDATEQIIGLEKKQLGILREQLELGVLTKLSVYSQEASLIQTQATLPILKKQLAQKRSQLTILTGHFPSEKRADIFTLSSLKLPKELPVRLPSMLVEQRPDIRASEAQLQAASAEIGIATANMLPKITLSGGYGTAARRSMDAFSPQAEIWNIGAGLLQPIFRAGQLRHQRMAAIAGYERAHAQYRSTVLHAFKNVSDSLYAVHFDAEALNHRVKAERIASKSMEAAQAQFKGGTITYLSLLDVQRTLLESRLDMIQARANRLADTVALFQALGGGLKNRENNADE